MDSLRIVSFSGLAIEIIKKHRMNLSVTERIAYIMRLLVLLSVIGGYVRIEGVVMK